MNLSDCLMTREEIENKIPNTWSVEDEEYDGRIKFTWDGTGNHIMINDWGEDGYLFSPMVETNGTGFTSQGDMTNQTTFSTLESAIKQAIHLINNWEKQYE